MTFPQNFPEEPKLEAPGYSGSAARSCRFRSGELPALAETVESPTGAKKTCKKGLQQRLKRSTEESNPDCV